jgi:hypothetical protein
VESGYINFNMSDASPNYKGLKQVDASSTFSFNSAPK